MNTLHKLEKQFSRILGRKWVTVTQESLSVKPGSAGEICRIMKSANRYRTPVTVRGGATGRWSSTRPPKNGILIDMRRMNRVKRIDKDADVITVEAGITFNRLESKLHRQGYRILIFPESGKTATVGGHLQTWGTSPFASSMFGDQSTQTTGLTVVLPDGKLVRTGSGALKTGRANFARRFFPADITGLFVGAESAFGIIAEVTLKIYELPETMLTRIAGFKDLDSATRALIQIQRAQSGRKLLSIVEQRLISRDSFLNIMPELGKSLKRISRVIVFRAEGCAEDVKRHMSETGRICRSENGHFLRKDVPEWWAGRFGRIASRLKGNRGPSIMLVVMVPLKKFLTVARHTEKFGRAYHMEIAMRGYPFAGPIMLAHALVPCQSSKSSDMKTALLQARELMEALIKLGCVPHRIGTHFLPVVRRHLERPYLNLISDIKKLLDPNNIMYPKVI